MELRHLRYFVTVAEELHFGRAALRLHISQPPLSQQIRALETEIDAELFARVGKRVKLTAAGDEFLVYARQVLSQVEQGVRSTQAIHRGQAGRLAVGFMTSMAYTYLPWVLRAFRARFPGVELVLTEQESWAQVKALREGRLHVGIVRGPVDTPYLTAVKALSEPFVAALPDTHPLAGTRSVRLARLANDDFILFPRAMGGHFYAAQMRLCEAAGFVPKVSQEAIQMHVAVGLVSAGIGVALVPASMQLLQMPGVAYKRLAGAGDVRAEIAIAAPADERSPILNAFREVAVEVISAGPGGVARLKAEP
jgi:DNA-binding transcriptional LysR family regulator